jgi:CRISPR-associated protein Cmr1
MDYIPDNAYPRAEFGLPIIFHFKDANDPPDTQLYPVFPGPGKIKADRMASPLILRAIRCANGETYSVIIRLRTHQITRVVLVGKQLEANGIVSSTELARYRDSPLRWAPKTGSALDAFIGFVKAERQFEEAKA